MKKTLSILLSISVINTALAADVTPAAVPKYLHVYDEHGNTYVDMPPHACSNNRYRLAPEHKKYDAIYSSLLAAQMAGKEVRLRVNGCNSQAQGHIIGVYLP